MSASFSASLRLIGRGTPEPLAETLLSTSEIGDLEDFASGPVDCRHCLRSEVQQRQIVAESHEPQVSASVVARRFNVNANQVFT